MLESREFRELLIADVALVRGVASARDVAAAIQRYWDERGRREASLASELAHVARLSPEALRPVEEEVDLLIEAAGGDPLLALTRHGGLERSMGAGLGGQSPQTGTPLHTLDPRRYVNFALAGHGGMGAVYMALDTEMNRLVAFKVVRTDTTEPPGGGPATSPLAALSPTNRGTPASDEFETLRVRFLQEAWITGGMEHPGIVPVYELGQTPGGIPYYTMRFVRGQRTLAQAIEEQRGKPCEDRLSLLEPFLKLCDTVRYAHAKGVIHRDLKPANVALGEFGEVVLLDWGLAKLEGREDVAASRWQEQVREFREAGDLRTIAGIVGTPGYMAPEAAGGRVAELDARSDVYSLGAILYEILTGRRPFEFRTFAEFLAAVTERDAPLACDVDPAVPRTLAALCAGCLARDRSARPTGVEQVAEGLRSWQAASALEREVESLLRDARAALEAAEHSEADARLVHVERAAGFLQQVEAKAPHDATLAEERRHAITLRERGIRERERASGRRLLKRVGIGALAAATAAAILVTSLIDRRRKEAEEARAAALAANAKATRRLEALARLFSLEVGDALPKRRSAARIRAAVDAQDSEAFFAEEERAREDSLLSLILPRGARPTDDLPSALFARESEAKARVVQSQRQYVQALQSGQGRSLLRTARTELSQALNELELVQLHSQRVTRAFSATAPLEPVTLQAFRASLGPEQAFVFFAVLDAGIAALVGNRTESHVVSIPDTPSLREDCTMLVRSLWDATLDPLPAVSRLRQALLDRLGLPKEAQEVIVLPDDYLLGVPFCVLDDERVFTYAPSAWVHLALHSEREMRGDGVLSLGDPSLSRSQPNMPPLPGAREEALRIGSPSLVGASATKEALLAAVGARSRWHAIHISAHGEASVDHPLQARIFLTPTEADSGHLTALDVAQTAFPADLVCLSVDDVGRSVESKSAVPSMARAFLYAGATRVILSTGPVEEESTLMLMLEFYRRWNPPDGSAGLGAAAALHAAQHHVRSQERWKHPGAWASWFLWGPD